MSTRYLRFAEGHNFNGRDRCAAEEPYYAEVRLQPLYGNEQESGSAALPFDLLIRDIYATNALPFVKKGKLIATIQPKDIIKAARAYAKPQV